MEVRKLPKQVPGKYIQCSICGLAGHTLVRVSDDVKDGYRHKVPAVCTMMRRNQPKK